MDFFASGRERRPERLSQSTRSFAMESLRGKYGDEAMELYALPMDGVPGFEDMCPGDRYDAAVRELAKNAPLRACPAERIAGSATLGLAIDHKVPVTFRGEPVLEGVSHLTLNFEKLLKLGISGYRREIAQRLEKGGLSEKQRAFLHSLENALESFALWHGRYLELAGQTSPEIYAVLSRVPLLPAETFHEAVQTVWMEFAFSRLCGVWPGIGRLDVLLGGYLERDLEAGRLDLAQAREILASMFIKGCEWIRSAPQTGSGDAQHYQNIVLGGIGTDGREVANHVTYLVLEIVEELAISDFPITVRVNESSPEKLLRRVAEVMRFGGGIVAVYNEPLILRSLANAGYPREEAVQFANDGCWEVQIPGCTNFIYSPFDALVLFERAMGLDGDGAPDCASEEELYRRFLSELKKLVAERYRWDVCGSYGVVDGKWQGKNQTPCSVVSLFEDGCIENAAGYYDLGPRYTVRSPHMGGAPDVANSLLAVRELVFRRKLVSLGELADILKANWEGHEELRLLARNGLKYYGNDSDEADGLMARILNDFADVVKAEADAHPDCPVRFVPGVSTFGRQIEWRYVRRATAFGYLSGEILSGNASPTPGTDGEGLTAVIRSHCKADLCRQTSGAALDVRVSGSALEGEKGLGALVGLIRAFVALGGFFMQVDTVSAETLRAAMEAPEAFKTLSVRVSGWNARFVTLNREWQEMVVNRTEQGI